MAKDAWNTRDPERVALVYNEDSWWRNRADYRLINELWTVTGNRIAVRFPYEWHDDSGNCTVRLAMNNGNSPWRA